MRNESAVSEAGSLTYKDPAIEMTTVFGDGAEQRGSFMDLHVDTGRLAALSQTVDYDVVSVGGEGVLFARSRGPGHAWLQSLPFSRLPGRIMANWGPAGRRTDEGSALGPIGDVLRGN